MAIDRKVFQKLSDMAKVPVAEAGSEEDLVGFGNVLAFVQQIGAVEIPDTTSESLDHVATVTRPDVPEDVSQTHRAAIIANFPQKHGEFLLVPKVLDK